MPFDHVNITKHNFAAMLPAVRAACQDATFLAIDAEFTGLFPDGVHDDHLDDYEERYRKLILITQQFIISQFGLTAFKWVPPSAGQRVGRWEARTFNFYIFPQPNDSTGHDRRFMCQASSLQYLAEQGFDFNKYV